MKEQMSNQGSIRPVCFAGTRRIAVADICSPFVFDGVQEPWRLPDTCLEAFARLLPILACGEESAIHVFSTMAALEAGPSNTCCSRNILSRQVLEKIAGDEMRHEAWLAAMRAKLPDTLEQTTRRKAQRFFAGLSSDDPATHFARIVALDSAVCQIFSPLLNSASPLAGVQEINITLNRIRSDEGHHVRLSREFALAWGATPTLMQDEWQIVRSQLVSLLQNVAEDLATLGADPDRLFGRLKHTPNFLQK